MVRKISGTILAGGTGRRFNVKMKPKIVIDGETIITRMISVIRDIFDEIIIVTNHPEEFKDFNFCRIVQDEILNAGPLGGIHAAMKTSAYEAIFVFAGDMPFLDKGIITGMIKVYNSTNCNVLIPGIEDYIEPLHSIYSISLTEHLEAYLKSDQSNAVRDYIKSQNVQYIQFEGSDENKKAFTNINSPSDIKLAEGSDRKSLP
jgi:molybdopterin-guanine dinucleotide biosynthesis protein A